MRQISTDGEIGRWEAGAAALAAAFGTLGVYRGASDEEADGLPE